MVQLRDDGVEPPVAEPVDDIAPVAVRQQVGIEPVVVGPRTRMGTDAGLCRGRGELVLA